MIEMKTTELIGPALDWAVAHAVKAWESAHELFPTMTLDPRFSGVEPRPYPRGEFGSMLMTCVLVPNNPFRQDPQPFCPSIDWSQGGPLIDKYKVDLFPTDPVMSKAVITPDLSEPHFYFRQFGPTPLIAAMRCLVASKLGDTVQVPKELLS